MTLRRVSSLELIKDKKGLARWRNQFSQLLNLHGVNDVMQMA